MSGVVKHSEENTDEDACATPEDSDVEAVLTQVAVTMHALVSQLSSSNQPILGPTVTAEVVVERGPISVLLNTGSPVSIVSLKSIVHTLAKQRMQDQTPQERRASVRR